MTANIYFTLDVETTTLDASTGHIRSVGWIIHNGSMEGLADEEYSSVGHTSLWDKDTLAFAANTYGPAFIEELTTGSKDWIAILTPLLDWLSRAVEDYSRNDTTVWLICNHPDFDATLLRQAYKIVGQPFPFKYDKVLDMASLCLGAVNAFAQRDSTDPQTMEEILRWAAPGGKEAVAHTALADCHRQLSILKKCGVCLP